MRDKELDELHDLARNMLIDVKRQLLAKQAVPGFSASDLKRVRKALSNLDTDYQAYGDIMSDNSGNAKGLMKAIRNGETAVMRAFELLPDDTIHHLIQQRTGGDFSDKVSGPMVREVINRLQQRYQMRFGQATGSDGVVRGDTALSNFAHKSDDTATGLERKSGIGKNPDPLTTSHRYGTAAYAKDFTPDELATVDSLEEAFIKRIDPQLSDLQIGQATDAPRVQAIREIPGLENAYKASNTAEDIAGMQQIVKGINPGIITDTYKQLKPIFSNGAVRIGTGLTGLGALIDAGDSIAGTYNATTKSGAQQLSGGLQAVQGLTGLASLKVGPMALPSVVAGGLKASIDTRLKKDAEIQEKLEYESNVLSNGPKPVMPKDGSTATLEKTKEPWTLFNGAVRLPDLGVTEMLGRLNQERQNTNNPKPEEEESALSVGFAEGGM